MPLLYFEARQTAERREQPLQFNIWPQNGNGKNWMLQMQSLWTHQHVGLLDQLEPMETCSMDVNIHLPL